MFPKNLPPFKKKAPTRSYPKKYLMGTFPKCINSTMFEQISV